MCLRNSCCNRKFNDLVKSKHSFISIKQFEIKNGVIFLDIKLNLKQTNLNIF